MTPHAPIFAAGGTNPARMIICAVWMSQTRAPRPPTCP